MKDEKASCCEQLSCLITACPVCDTALFAEHCHHAHPRLPVTEARVHQHYCPTAYIWNAERIQQSAECQHKRSE